MPLDPRLHAFRPLLQSLEDRCLLSGVFRFGNPFFYAGENGGHAKITVRRTGDSSTPSDVDYTTQNGTAAAGVNYVATSGTLNFAAFETTKNFFVTSIVTPDPHGDLSLSVRLSNPTGGATLGRPTRAVVRFMDSRLGFAADILAEDINSPIGMAAAPDGRIFVAEQGGALRVIKDDQLLPTPFLTVPWQEGDYEDGLIGVAVDPDFSTNNYIYVNYTTYSPTKHQTISRFTADGDIAFPGSELKLFELDTSGVYHVGGPIMFGPDGKLYIATGEGLFGSAAQSLTSTNGKILRINKDGAIPTDNPFYNQTGGNDRSIYALGFRNAFGMNIDPQSGRIFVGEVGGGAFEEVNEVFAGGNYGWPNSEGPKDGNDPPTTVGTYYDPLHWYSHSVGCSITGVSIFNPSVPTAFSEGYKGKVFFSDFCSSTLYWIDPNNPTTATPFRPAFVPGPLAMMPDHNGNLLVLDRGNALVLGGTGDFFETGHVTRIKFVGLENATDVTDHPDSQTKAVGQTATFNVGATGSGTLMYQWQRDFKDVLGATLSTYTTPPLTGGDNNKFYRCVVCNEFGCNPSEIAKLTVTGFIPPPPDLEEDVVRPRPARIIRRIEAVPPHNDEWQGVILGLDS